MIKEAIDKVVKRENLKFSEAREVMLEIMENKASAAQIGSMLTALRMKGETVEEIAGCAQTMREKATKIFFEGSNLIDTCGTGGDRSGTFNISTTTAFVVAGAGVPVAKHGNRSVSSKSGSADLLEALGVNLDISPIDVERILKKIGIGFLYAPRLHKAMQYAIGPRKEIGIQSIFNILGPLTNPAGAKNQLLGVYDPNLTETMAHVLERLGVNNAFVVYGLDGLDEISTIGPTKVTQLQKGIIKSFVIQPEDFGLSRVTLQDLQGGNAQKNVTITRSVLSGEKGPHRDIVLINAAAAFVVSGLARDLLTGIKIAEESIDSGQAMSKLNQLIRETSGLNIQSQ